MYTLAFFSSVVRKRFIHNEGARSQSHSFESIFRCLCAFVNHTIWAIETRFSIQSYANNGINQFFNYLFNFSANLPKISPRYLRIPTELFGGKMNVTSNTHKQQYHY